ncbi:hypothetical protein BCD64_23720 [Nostoc sp. MBR 210]|nr:hypothetical protein BCD64_23720 [Nostoc sp. MBR 210]
MGEVPYLGLNPFSENDAPFFFGRDEQTRAIARNLRVSRLTVLLGESGVGKSSILQAGVVPQLHQEAEQNRQEYDGNPLWAIVVFNAWHSDEPLMLLVNEIRNSVAAALKRDPTSLKDESTIIESLQTWSEMLSDKPEKGQIFIILDQFEEYFQYHSQKSGEKTFADEFPRWVNHPKLSVNFLIAMRQDALAKLNHFQGRIINIFDNQLILQRLDRASAREAIVKPIGQYNVQEIITRYFWKCRLTLLFTPNIEKSHILKYAIPHRLQQIAQQNLHNQGVSQKIATVIFNSWRGNPVMNLKQQVYNEIRTLFPNVEVPQDESSLAQNLQEWAESISTQEEKDKFFIILDQFEDFFEYQQPEMGETSFLAEFARAVNNSQVPVHFLIVIRNEALSLLKYFEQRIPGIFDNHLQIKQLEEDSQIADLAKPIEEPKEERSEAIAIESELVEQVLNQVQVGMISLIETDQRRNSIPSTSQENIEIETPFLELVMERLWKEEIGKKNSRCLRLETLNQFSIPDKNITGAQGIAEEHLRKQMNLLSERERDAMATVFKYLVSGGGTKIAYPVLDLQENTGLNKSELTSVLDKLDKQRILRTVKAPNHSDIKGYEIFHDILAVPILNWRTQYLQEKRLKQAEDIGKQKAEEIKQKGLLIVALSGTVVFIVSLALLWGIGKQKYILQTQVAEMEAAKDAFSSKPSESSGQIVGLIKAIKAGDELSKSLNNPLLNLLPVFRKSKNKGIASLQYILNNIQEKNHLRLPSKSQSEIVSFSISPDNKFLATGYTDGSVHLWRLTGKKLKTIKVPRVFVWSLGFSYDNQLLATGSDDGKVRLWKLKGEVKEPTKTISVSYPPASVISLSFKPDNQLLVTSSANGRVHKLIIKDGKKILLNEDKKNPVYSLSFNRNGQRLASSYQDGKVCLWDLQNPKICNSIQKQDTVWSLRFSRDGQRLATGYQDGTVRLISLQGKKLQQFPKAPPAVKVQVLSISFTPDDKVMITGNKDGMIRFWNLQNKKPQTEQDLNTLLTNGCQWLKEYLTTHPNDKNNPSFCQHK